MINVVNKYVNKVLVLFKERILNKIKSIGWITGGRNDVLYYIHVLYCMQYKTSPIKVNGGLQKFLTFLAYFCSLSFKELIF